MTMIDVWPAVPKRVLAYCTSAALLGKTKIVLFNGETVTMLQVGGPHLLGVPLVPLGVGSNNALAVFEIPTALSFGIVGAWHGGHYFLPRQAKKMAPALRRTGAKSATSYRPLARLLVPPMASAVLYISVHMAEI